MNWNEVVVYIACAHIQENFWAKNVNVEIFTVAPLSKVIFEMAVREGLPTKSSCSFGFCPNEGGGLPKFVVHFLQTVYIG